MALPPVTPVLHSYDLVLPSLQVLYICTPHGRGCWINPGGGSRFGCNWWVLYFCSLKRRKISNVLSTFFWKRGCSTWKLGSSVLDRANQIFSLFKKMVVTLKVCGQWKEKERQSERVSERRNLAFILSCIIFMISYLALDEPWCFQVLVLLPRPSLIERFLRQQVHEVNLVGFILFLKQNL